ncbi:MAG TPA: flagellar motor switch protein FliN [Phycisphaerae bacterium]|nr:flagellar motor switch protein FliN [Phycisphaerae bacterium]
MAEPPDSDKPQEHEPGQDAVTDATPPTSHEQAASPELDAEAQAVFQAAEQQEDGKSPTNHAEPEKATALEEAEPGAVDQSASASADAAPSSGEDHRMGAVAATTQAFNPPDLTGATPAVEFGKIDLLDDVELDVKIELGRTQMYIEDVIRLGVGSVVELDKLAGDPVDVYVNDRLVARGEVLVLNDNFCVRINDILSPIPELESA